MFATSPSGETPGQIRTYISDVLGQLAELAHLLDDRRLETSLRLLSLEVELSRRPGEGPPPREPGAPH